MIKHIIETVTSRLRGDITEGQFLNAAAGAKTLMTTCSGFIRRRLSRGEGGTWIEHVEWASMVDAKYAAASIGKDTRALPFISAIEASSIAINYSELMISAA